ncbi:hypothetical protein PJL18_03535 [Paenarthrobacter nicotinovorans]|nr:hypothetical protein [Paenarthrobacter nicotinovorans]
MGRNALEGVLPLRFLRTLGRVPLEDDFLDTGRKAFLEGTVGLEDVPVPPDHLGIDVRGHGLEVEAAALLGEPGVKYYLKQYIAQLAAKLIVNSTRLDRVHHFIGFLDQVLHQRLMSQGTHPGAMLTQCGDRPDELCEPVAIVSRGWRRHR